MVQVPQTRPGMLSRLLRDRSGNTLALIAAATTPLVAMVGSAVDIGRGYVAQSRLQQACDAGTLAARKKLGSDLPPSNQVLGQVRNVGNEFFDLNFPKGRYNTTDLSFVMTLEEDFAISGQASAVLPTAVMGIFGKHTIPIAVSCQSRMNFTNLDIMMVLDTTGSMRHTNAGDTLSRIDSMRSVIRKFHGNLEEGKSPGTRVRYGFVPYSTNVNVGAHLKNNWVVNSWSYQSRRELDKIQTESSRTYNTNWKRVSGERTPWSEHSRYDATYYPETTITTGEGDAITTTTRSERWACEGGQPHHTISRSDVADGTTTTEPFDGPPAGERTIVDRTRISNGTRYRTRREGDTCIVEKQTDIDYKETYDRITEPTYRWTNSYLYEPISRNVANWRSQVGGCIEERDTYDITDYDNVDLTRALDLDINLVPGPNDGTKWRPQYNNVIYARSMTSENSGSFTPEPVTTGTNYIRPGTFWMSNCPAPARKLAEMDAEELDTYLGSLNPGGATYHDIGMIWGGRFVSPKGIFASENADISANRPTSRHLIFLTDGQTEPYDIAYGAYGLEPLDRRRWDPDTSSMTLKETIEARFVFACNEVRKTNTTVWIIAFGTEANPAMSQCAGPGRVFEASSSAELDRAFDAIARSLGDLRISR